MKAKRLVLAFTALLLAILPVSLVSTAFADDTVFTWDGSAGDGNMNTAANWVSNAVPSTNDVMIFPNSSGDIHNNIPGNLHFQKITAGDGVNFDGNDLYVGEITNNGTEGNATYNSAVHLIIDVSGTVGQIHNGIFNAIVYMPATNSYEIDGTVEINGGLNSSTSSGLYFNDVSGAADDVIYITHDSALTVPVYVEQGSVVTSATVGLGTNSVTVNSTGNLIFAATEETATFPQNVYMNGGTLKAESSSSLNPNGPHGSINLTGALELVTASMFTGYRTDFNATGVIAGSAILNITPGSDGNLIIASGANSSILSTGIYKPSVVTTTYSNSNSDPVSINENNIVVVDGARGDTDVNFGGVLKGTGTVGTLTVFAHGTVAPGHSPGCLNTGDLSLNGVYHVEIGGTTACTEYDQLKVTGTVDVTDGLPMVDLYGGFVPKVGQSYTIIDNDSNDAVTGNFNNLSEGASFTSEGVTYRITYRGGDGNDVVLTVAGINGSQLPGAPNTGMKLLTNSPLITLGMSITSALTLTFISRRLPVKI